MSCIHIVTAMVGPCIDPLIYVVSIYSPSITIDGEYILNISNGLYKGPP